MSNEYEIMAAFNLLIYSSLLRLLWHAHSHYVSHDVTSAATIRSIGAYKFFHLLEIRGKGIFTLYRVYDKTEMFRLTWVLDQSSKTKGLISVYR